MSKVPEEIKKQLLDYPFSDRITTPQATKTGQETATTSETGLNTGVGA